MANSELARGQLSDTFGIDTGEVSLIYSGVDLEAFHPDESQREARQPARLLFVGHHFFLKGLHCLLAAMASARSTGLDFALQVVGNGPIEHFRRLAARLGVSDRVSFRNFVSRTEMPDLYRSSAALVHPTFYDPCSLATLEAMACGCPVITTLQNGASELINSGRSGWVIEQPRDIAALATAIRKTLAPGVGKEIGREAAAIARDKLDLHHHVEAVIKWLQG